MVLDIDQSRSLFSLPTIFFLSHRNVTGSSRLICLLSDGSEFSLSRLVGQGGRTSAQCSRHADALSSPNEDAVIRQKLLDNSS